MNDVGTSAIGDALVPLAAALALSILGPPWVRATGRDPFAPSLRDQWMLFSFLHPIREACLRWLAAIVLGAAVSVLALVVAQQHDLLARTQQTVIEVSRRARWR